MDKSKGRFQELKTIGVSSDEQELSALYQQGKKWIDLHCGNCDMFLESERQREEKIVTEYLLGNVENILLNGTQFILNEVFRLVGFDAIDDDILKHLVVARLCQPTSPFFFSSLFSEVSPCSSPFLSLKFTLAITPRLKQVFLKICASKPASFFAPFAEMPKYGFITQYNFRK
ncbi:MAG: hypothetical protein LBV02_08915 [Bacteroidales bacterium]|nr:hypothetical protein [Bacteroidales bacterium]